MKRAHILLAPIVAVIMMMSMIPANASIEDEYVDVIPGKWYVPYVDYAVEEEWMNGTSETLFEPNRAVTRAMFIQTLYAIAGKPEVYSGETFNDVVEGAYYEDAVAWALENGVASGLKDGKFAPNEEVTRQEAATFFQAYAKSIWGLDVSNVSYLNQFPDKDEVSNWAMDGVGWAVKSGIMTGKKENEEIVLDPKGHLTRAELAAMLKSFSSCPPLSPDEIADTASNYRPSKQFADVPSGSWYFGAVTYVTNRGYMSGVGNNTFSPNMFVTRASLAQILYSQSGRPKNVPSAGFRDINSSKWYANAVNWAANSGLVSGYSNHTFRPDATITRQQLIAILYKYAKSKNYTTTATGNLNQFKDAGKVSSYAVTPMKWAVGHGIISGTNSGIDPDGKVTRAQMAVILQSFDQEIR